MFSLSSGIYIYTEASSPRVRNQRARLISPKIELKMVCLDFWYNMYGANMGVLKVYMKMNERSRGRRLWYRYGDLGQEWHNAKLSIASARPYQVNIIAHWSPSLYNAEQSRGHRTTTTQRYTTQHNTTQHNTTRHSTAQHSTTQHNIAQHSTAQYSTAQHNTAQHSTAQQHTAQHSTAQHSTANYRLHLSVS